MGLYTTIHIGAGIKIPTQKEKYLAKVKSCGEHIHYKDAKFCERCGKEIKEIEVEKEQILCSEYLIGSENFFHHFEEDETYFFSNLGHGFISNQENVIVTLDPEIIKKRIEEFKTHHSSDIILLEEKIKSSVNVEFFFLHDYS